MAWTSVANLKGVIAPEVVDGAFTTAGTLDAASQAMAIGAAQARVKAALRSAGITPPTDAQLTAMLASDEETADQARALQLAVAGEFLMIATGRKGRDVPAAYASLITYTEEIEKGSIAFPALTTTARDAIGGVDWTNSEAATTGSTPPIFSRGMGR